MAKSNEYWMLRRAARHVVVGLWTTDRLWSHPEDILDAFDTVHIIRNAAVKIPDKTPEQNRKRWYHLS